MSNEKGRLGKEKGRLAKDQTPLGARHYREGSGKFDPGGTGGTPDDLRRSHLHKINRRRALSSHLIAATRPENWRCLPIPGSLKFSIQLKKL
jgi:hypothetical protein